MSRAPSNAILRLLPSLTDVAFLLPLALLFLKMDGAGSILGDGDTGWHIRTGDWIASTHRIPDKDIFSYTRAGEPWFAWEWLWDVTFAWLHLHGGMAAVVLASIFIICLTFALLFRLVRNRCGQGFIAIGVTVLAAGASAIHWLARPHLVTLLFLVIFAAILERVREGETKWLALLPFLMLFWTNLHGGFIAGIVLVGAYAVGVMLAGAVAADTAARGKSLAQAKPYLACLAACLCATLVNPYFYHLHVHIYKYLTDSSQLLNIDEFKPMSFQHPLAFYFEPMLLLGILAAGWSLYRKRFADVVLLVVWGHLALRAARNIPIFAIIAAPAVAQMIREVLVLLETASLAAWLRRAASALANPAAEFDVMDRVGRVHAVSLAAGLILASLFYSPVAGSKFRAEYDPKRYPVRAVNVLRGSEFASSIFTNDEWGDYLIYRLYPATKVFIDGRSDFYGRKFGEKYLDTMNVKYDWQETLSRYGIQTVLLPVDVSLSGALKESNRWRVVYDDGTAIVFQAVRSETSLIPQISSYQTDKTGSQSWAPQRNTSAHVHAQLRSFCV